MRGFAPNPVVISALYRKNFDQLCQEIARNLENYVKTSFTIPINQNAMSFLSWLHGRVNNLKVTYESNRMVIQIEALPQFIGSIQGQVGRLGGSFYLTK